MPNATSFDSRDRGGKPSHTHTRIGILNPSTSAKPVMTKLQNLFVVNMDMTLKFSLFTLDYFSLFTVD